MLKYLIVVLDDSSISYCHYENSDKSCPMSIDTLREGILFSMKHNLSIQYLLPPKELPQEYWDVMSTMEHAKIGFLGQENIADVIVIEGIKSAANATFLQGKRYIVRTDVATFLNDYKILESPFSKDINLNVVFTDVESFNDDMINAYSLALAELGEYIKDQIIKGKDINTNLLTDRIALDKMNNCGAGDTCITLTPDGKFYICPGFYYENIPYGCIGSLEDGFEIPNRRLYKLECAPLCRTCDAYHCKRCILLNKKLTYEVNVPSRQQCVMAHIERNASKQMLEDFQKMKILKDKHIGSIDYLDPFEKFQNS